MNREELEKWARVFELLSKPIDPAIEKILRDESCTWLFIAREKYEQATKSNS